MTNVRLNVYDPAAADTVEVTVEVTVDRISVYREAR